MTLLVPGLIYLSLLTLLAVISASETAVHSARDLDQRSFDGESAAVRRRLLSIRANPFRHLHRALLLSAALNLALASTGFALVIGPFRSFGWNAWISAAVLFSASVLLGDILPKFLAARSPSRVLVASTRLFHPLRQLLDPLVTLADRAADVILGWLVPKSVKMRVPITREEFETLVEMREEQGLLGSAEAAIIREVLAMEDLVVRDCMVPRVDLTLLPLDRPARWPAQLEQARSRFAVVHRDTPDQVHGILDVHAWKMAGRPDAAPLVRPAQFVPETLPVLQALENHLRDAAGCLLILDEYGGLEGLISQEEITDWLLYDAAPWQGEGSEIRDLGNRRFLLDGLVRLDHLQDELGLDFADAEVDTIGGLVFNRMGRVPKAGERIQAGGAEIKVRRVTGARVQQVELRLLQQAEHQAEARGGEVSP